MLLSSTSWCSLILNRPPVMCHQNTLLVSTGNSHWVRFPATTKIFIFFLSFFPDPFMWECFYLVCVKGENLIIVMIKPFQIHKLWLLSGRGVSGLLPKGVLTAHNWWSVEYATAASSTTQQYKGKTWRSWKSRVVVAQCLEHWWLKPVDLGSIPSDDQDFTFFSFAFLKTTLGEKVSIYH